MPQQVLNVVHDFKEFGIQMAQYGLGQSQENTGIHIARPGTHEDPGRGMKFTSHRTSLESIDLEESFFSKLANYHSLRLLSRDFGCPEFRGIKILNIKI
jgi:hypothetical protein